MPSSQQPPILTSNLNGSNWDISRSIDDNSAASWATTSSRQQEPAGWLEFLTSLALETYEGENTAKRRRLKSEETDTNYSLEAHISKLGDIPRDVRVWLDQIPQPSDIRPISLPEELSIPHFCQAPQHDYDSTNIERHDNTKISLERLPSWTEEDSTLDHENSKQQTDEIVSHGDTAITNEKILSHCIKLPQTNEQQQFNTKSLMESNVDPRRHQLTAKIILETREYLSSSKFQRSENVAHSNNNNNNNNSNSSLLLLLDDEDEDESNEKTTACASVTSNEETIIDPIDTTVTASSLNTYQSADSIAAAIHSNSTEIDTTTISSSEDLLNRFAGVTSKVARLSNSNSNPPSLSFTTAAVAAAAAGALLGFSDDGFTSPTDLLCSSFLDNATTNLWERKKDHTTTSSSSSSSSPSSIELLRDKADNNNNESQDLLFKSLENNKNGGTTDQISEEGFQGEDGQWYRRPDIDEATLERLCDLTELEQTVAPNIKVSIPYSEGISFALGEGGRELLRACLNAKGCKGRQLQGASVPMLLQLAHEWGLWNIALRIKVERLTGSLCSKHDAFVRFKAVQSHLRKFLKREHMHTERDGKGQITDIRFDEMKHLTLGKEGREKLRTQLRRLHDRDPFRMDDLLERYGFRYSELRNATVPQLLKMAYICCMWNDVIDACKKQEAKRDSKPKKEINSSNRSFQLASSDEDTAIMGPKKSSNNVVVAGFSLDQGGEGGPSSSSSCSTTMLSAGDSSLKTETITPISQTLSIELIKADNTTRNMTFEHCQLLGMF